MFAGRGDRDNITIAKRNDHKTVIDLEKNTITYLIVSISMSLLLQIMITQGNLNEVL